VGQAGGGGVAAGRVDGGGQTCQWKLSLVWRHMLAIVLLHNPGKSNNGKIKQLSTLP